MYQLWLFCFEPIHTPKSLLIHEPGASRSNFFTLLCPR